MAVCPKPNITILNELVSHRYSELFCKTILLFNEAQDMKLVTVAKKVFDKILDVFASGGTLVMGFVIVVITVEIVSRYFFNRPFTWTVEVTEYSLLWITFLSAAWVLKKEGHVVTDLVLGRVSPRAQRALNIFTSTIATCVCLILTFYGAKVTVDLYQRGLHLATVIKPLAYILYLIIPVGGLLLSIQFIRRTYGFIARGKVAS